MVSSTCLPQPSWAICSSAGNAVIGNHSAARTFVAWHDDSGRVQLCPEVEDEMPRAVAERLDVIEARLRLDPELLAEDPGRAVVRVLWANKRRVGQEPAALAVVRRHVPVLHQQHAIPGQHRDIRDELVRLAFHRAVSRGRAAR